MNTTPINDGGPAYPQSAACVPDGSIYYGSERGPEFAGMTLRDRLAIAAMQGDWAAQDVVCGGFPDDAQYGALLVRARLYYRAADAVLEAREKSKKEESA